MKTLNLGLFQQQPSSADCGPSCTKMILDFFNKSAPFESIKSSLHYYGRTGQNGTSLFDNGVVMLQHGLAATAIIANPKLFPPDKSETWATKPQLTSHVEHYRRRHRGEARQCAGEFLSFMQNGGEVGVEIPTFEHIVKAIDSGALVMACMYARAMGSHEGGYHFVVISGYRDGELFINNPLPGSSRQSWKPADQFFFGLFASSMYEIDNGGLLVVGDSLK